MPKMTANTAAKPPPQSDSSSSSPCVRRNSQHSLQFCNLGKWQWIKDFLKEYRRVLTLVMDDLWENGYKDDKYCFDIKNNQFSLPTMLPSQYLNTLLKDQTCLSSRMQQCIAKQASSMIRGAVKKYAARLFMQRKLQHLGEKPIYLQRCVSLYPPRKPTVSEKTNAELDSRFVDIREPTHHTHQSSFGYMVRVSNVFGSAHKTQQTQRRACCLPIKDTKVSIRWKLAGQRCDSIRLNETSLWLIYNVPQAPARAEGTVLGADQGVTTTLTLSDGQITQPCPHGHTLASIMAKLARCQPGSRGFARAVAHRKNYIRWAINGLDLNEVREVRLERLRRVHEGQKGQQFLKHWAYTLIKEKLVARAELEGFQIREMSNEFRSQRCSQCGWVRKANRKRKTFSCSHCSFCADADLNAASNLRLDLCEIPFWVRLQQLNRKGFFWWPDRLSDVTGAPIVPQTS